jgi:hypothetical protein
VLSDLLSSRIDLQEVFQYATNSFAHCRSNFHLIDAGVSLPKSSQSAAFTYRCCIRLPLPFLCSSTAPLTLPPSAPPAALPAALPAAPPTALLAAAPTALLAAAPTALPTAPSIRKKKYRVGCVTRPTRFTRSHY